jgi:Ni,Fe-hydrogenase III large subunit
MVSISERNSALFYVLAAVVCVCECICCSNCSSFTESEGLERAIGVALPFNTTHTRAESSTLKRMKRAAAKKNLVKNDTQHAPHFMLILFRSLWHLQKVPFCMLMTMRSYSLGVP